MLKGFRLIRQIKGIPHCDYGAISKAKAFRVFPIIQSPNGSVHFQKFSCSAKLTQNKPEAPSGSNVGDNSSSVPPDHPSEDAGKKSTKRNAALALGFFVLAAAVFKVSSIKPNSLKDVSAENKDKKRRVYKRPREIVKNPSTSIVLPDEIQYLLIGGGTASFSAFRAIKSVDPTAKVLVIGDEPYYPYMRPPLSKEIWYSDSEPSNLSFKQWNGTERSLYYEPEDFYTRFEDLKKEPGGVSVARGWKVSKIDVGERKVTLEDGKEIKYEKCLIATGAKPKNLPLLESASDEIKDKVTLFRNIFDYKELCEIVSNGSEAIAIVGGGFLGSELACSIAKKGREKNLKVYQIFKENGNMGKILPEYLSAWTSKKVEKEGVTIFNNAQLKSVSLSNEDQLKITLDNGKEVVADHLVVAIGVTPNTELASTSKLEVDDVLGGFLVNAELEARSDLYIAGDCACFYDTDLGRRRVEHHDHAVVSGRLAGENMTGAGKPYWHQSMFWSDIGPEVGFEAIGVIDSSLPTVGVYAKESGNLVDRNGEKKSDSPIKEENTSTQDTEPYLVSTSSKEDEDYGKGVIFYLRDGIIVGMVLWNIFNRMTTARQILKERKKYEDLNEVAKLFNIHSN